MTRLLAAAALLLGAATAEAGPWAIGKGRLYAKISLQHLRSTELAAPDGTLFTIPRFTKDEANLYAIYGLSDSLTLHANVPFLRSSDLNDALGELDRETGFGDVQFGAQRQLGRRGPWVWALRGSLQAPTGDETRAQGLLPTGSGVWEGDLVLGLGRSLGGGRGWAFVELGPQLRGGGLRDGVVYGAQLGWRVAARLQLAANLRGVEPYSHEAPETAIGSPVGVGDRVTYIAYGPSVFLKLGSNTTLQLDYDGAFRARNLAKGPVFRLGLAFAR